MKRTFTAVVWKEGDWFIAQCLEVDVASQGESEEEAWVNLREALELYFEAPQVRQVEVEVRGVRVVQGRQGSARGGLPAT
jgi:predicted RNase H-like HicB family nuclease